MQNIYYKITYCRQYNTYWGCPRGDDCQYAHEEDELRTVRQNRLEEAKNFFVVDLSSFTKVIKSKKVKKVKAKKSKKVTKTQWSKTITKKQVSAKKSAKQPKNAKQQKVVVNMTAFPVSWTGKSISAKKDQKVVSDVETQDYSIEDIKIEKEDTISSLTCDLCQLLFVEPVTTSCKHSFCAPCLKQVGNALKRNCPTCNKDLMEWGMDFGLFKINKELRKKVSQFAPKVHAQRTQALTKLRKSLKKKKVASKKDQTKKAKAPLKIFNRITNQLESVVNNDKEMEYLLDLIRGGQAKKCQGKEEKNVYSKKEEILYFEEALQYLMEMNSMSEQATK